MKWPELNRHVVGMTTLLAVLGGLAFLSGWMSGGTVVSTASTGVQSASAPATVWRPPEEIAHRKQAN